MATSKKKKPQPAVLNIITPSLRHIHKRIDALESQLRNDPTTTAEYINDGILNALGMPPKNIDMKQALADIGQLKEQLRSCLHTTVSKEALSTCLNIHSYSRVDLPLLASQVTKLAAAVTDLQNNMVYKHQLKTAVEEAVKEVHDRLRKLEEHNKLKVEYSNTFAAKETLRQKVEDKDKKIDYLNHTYNCMNDALTKLANDKELITRDYAQVTRELGEKAAKINKVKDYANQLRKYASGTATIDIIAVAHRLEKELA